MPLIKELKSEKGFDKFISGENSVVIVYHFLCNGCKVYIEDLKKNPEIFNDIGLAKIHMTLDWVIDKAELYGDVKEENTFLAARFGVGNLFPTTLFFKSGELIKKVDGALNTRQLRDIADDTFGIESR
jgi:thiol-disulfide isomerase/thioredoxin